MTPEQLSKSNSEHGHQRALFAWANMAEMHGFAAAWTDASYSTAPDQRPQEPVPELKWCHAIPNGGLREKQTASMLKAEGVKRGIPDVFLPLPLWGFHEGRNAKCILYAGLYVEMKRPKSEGRSKGTTSDVQDDCIAWLRHSGYAVSVCFRWDDAAREIQSYVEAVRKGEQKA